jgi:hypothetical protein
LIVYCVSILGQQWRSAARDIAGAPTGAEKTTPAERLAGPLRTEHLRRWPVLRFRSTSRILMVSPRKSITSRPRMEVICMRENGTASTATYLGSLALVGGCYRGGQRSGCGSISRA